MKLTLLERNIEVDNVESFVWSADQDVDWQAGQFIELTLKHPSPDSRGIKHWFTISAAPHEGHLRYTTRFAGEESSTFKKALFNLNIGDQVQATLPEGDFIVEDPDKEYVFIAGGIGITPFRSIITDLVHRDQPLNINLIYANRDEDNIVFELELEEISALHPSFQINYIFSPEKIDIALIKQLVPDLKQPIFYVSGPEPFVEYLNKTLLKMAINPDKIKTDFFPNYKAY